jgi:hypothetical protein
LLSTPAPLLGRKTAATASGAAGDERYNQTIQRLHTTLNLRKVEPLVEQPCRVRLEHDALTGFFDL